MTDPRTPPSRPNRSIRLIQQTDQAGVAVFCVSAGRGTAYYTLREIPCEIGGRGFAVHRLGLGNLYHVRIGAPEECSCECLGWLAHGHCRHVSGLLALMREGKL